LVGPDWRGVTGRAVDAHALAAEATAALFGDGRLAGLRPLQPARDADEPPPPEAEPGRRPSARVRRAVRNAAEDLQRYPDAGAALAARLAELHGLGAERIALSGGGASELLERSVRAFCAP